MIICNDVISEIALDLSFSQMSISREDLTLPMCYILATEAPTLNKAEDRQNWILDANYKAVNIDAKVEVMDYLNDQQKQSLNKTLKKFPKLFSGGLGTLDI